MRFTPFGPGRRDDRQAAETPVESALRRSLAAHAFETPDADELARRILAATEDAAEADGPSGIVTPLHRPRAGRDDRPEQSPWRARALPLVAAAAVVAAVGIGAAVVSSQHDGNHGQQAASHGPSATGTSAPATFATPSTATPTTAAPTGTSGLTDVKILDLTFYRGGGIALASSQCIKQPRQRCTALLVTTNGSRWTSTGSTPFDVEGITAGCPADKCVDHIRFASASTGYAYGPQALFMTTNGGQSWQPQSGGAEALETLDNNVIRVGTGTSTSCLPGCPYVVQTAAIGSANWTTVTLPGGTPHGDGVQLSRGGGTHNQNAYLLVTQNPAGGSNDETSTLYRSTDDGAHWVTNGEPCPTSNGTEVDSYQVAAGSGGNVTVLCRTRLTGPFRVATSSDSGKTFTLETGTIPFADVADPGYSDDGGALPTVLAGDPATVLAVAGSSVWVSRDGGSTFSQSPDLVGRFASVGFESQTVGRAISADGTQIWTTRNAGRSWSRVTP